MPALATWLLYDTIARCTPAGAGGKPFAPPALVASIAQGESGRDPLAIHDNATGAELHPPTLEEAVATALRLLAAGHRVDLGLMQVDAPQNLARHGLTVRSAFDGCQSVRAGVEILTGRLSTYNTGSPTSGLRTYVPLIMAASSAVVPGPGLDAPQPRPPRPEAASDAASRPASRNLLPEPPGWSKTASR